MQVKLNAFRGDDRPGDVIDVPDSDGATLIAHGAAWPVDGIGTQAAAKDAGGRTVSGSAALAAASGTETEKP